MAKVDYTLLFEMLIATINAAPTFTTVPTDGKQTAGALKECVLLGDADVVSAYLDTLDLDERENFLVLSDPLDHGDELPAHVGKPGDKVFVQVNAADADFIRSTRAPSIEQIEKWRRNLNNIYGTVAHDAVGSPLGARHRATSKHLYFTGHKGKIYLPQFTIDRQTPKCQAAERHTSLVHSCAVMRAYKEGYVSDYLFKEHLEIAIKGLVEIRAQGMREDES